MRQWQPISILCTLFPIILQGGPALELRSIKLSGINYVNLEAWASRWGLDIEEEYSKTLKLINDSYSLIFTEKERLVRLNGLAIWLAYPIRKHNNIFYAATIDLDRYIEPILKPSSIFPNRPVRKIVIDPGHGGKDPGCMANGLIEKELTLDIAMKTLSLLKKWDLNVKLTRNSDVYVELVDRIKIAKAYNADIFISIHFNATEVKSVKGVEVYAMPPAGCPSTANPAVVFKSYQGNRYDKLNTLLAYCVHQTLISNLNANDRGIRRARFVVLRDINIPAILIEGGYLSSPDDAKLLKQTTYRNRLANAIALGIKKYTEQID